MEDEIYRICKGKDVENPGLIYVPYIMKEHDEESLIEYNDFMKEYRAKHKFCPECGSEKHSTTLVGYIMKSDKRDEYKDKNICICQDCGNRHTAHDRVMEKN